MATSPVTCCSAAHRWTVDAGSFRRNYKEVLSGFNQWEQKDHASDWILLPKNCGTRLSIDETSLHDDLFTILSNKDGHGKSGTIVAMVRGTKASDVIAQLMKLPQEQRLAVTEVTMDFSDSMMRIVRAVFPNAMIIIDCFHIIKRCGEAVEEIRLKEKRNAVKEQNKAKAEHKKKLEQLIKARKAYRKSIRKHIRGRNVVANPPGSARSLFRKNFPTEIRRSSCLREAADFCPRAAINGLTHRNNAQNYSSTCIRKSRRLTILSTTSAPSSATKALTGIRQEKNTPMVSKGCRLPTA